MKVTAYVQIPALRGILAEKHVTKILKCFTISAAPCICICVYIHIQVYIYRADDGPKNGLKLVTCMTELLNKFIKWRTVEHVFIELQFRVLIKEC